MTVAVGTNFDGYDSTQGSLSPGTFDVGGVQYTVDTLGFATDDNLFEFQVTPALPFDSFTLTLGDETLRVIAQELVQTIRHNVTIDWTLRENVRANLRVLVRRILRKHGYPPDKQEKATVTVLEQAEVLSEGWALA